jgi:hypothetical protein
MAVRADILESPVDMLQRILHMNDNSKKKGDDGRMCFAVLAAVVRFGFRDMYVSLLLAVISPIIQRALLD